MWLAKSQNPEFSASTQIWKQWVHTNLKISKWCGRQTAVHPLHCGFWVYSLDFEICNMQSTFLWCEFTFLCFPLLSFRVINLRLCKRNRTECGEREAHFCRNHRNVKYHAFRTNQMFKVGFRPNPFPILRNVSTKVYVTPYSYELDNHKTPKMFDILAHLWELSSPLWAAQISNVSSPCWTSHRVRLSMNRYTSDWVCRGKARRTSGHVRECRPSRLQTLSRD